MEDIKMGTGLMAEISREGINGGNDGFG